MITIVSCINMHFLQFYPHLYCTLSEKPTNYMYAIYTALYSYCILHGHIKVAINHLRAPPLFEAIQTHDAIDMRFNAHRT